LSCGHVIGHLALVLTSTREIVKNTMNEFHDVAPKLETLSAYGVHPFYHQVWHLVRGVDIVVGNPDVLLIFFREALSC
jgi:superfamily II DNA/RNA helicase